MPIYQTDPWRVQFFEHVHCPDDVIIPTKDWEAWPLYPAHRWIYDKLAVALSQGLDAAPHGVIPPRFPVFSKPMMNLRSMGAGSMPIPDIETYRASLNPGHFWCTLLTGAHVSTDAAIVNGNAVWWRHATGTTAPGGTFDYWHIHAEPMPGDRRLVRRLGQQAPRRLHRHGQFRNHRQPHHRGASALRRSMARSLWSRMG